MWDTHDTPSRHYFPNWLHYLPSQCWAPKYALFCWCSASCAVQHELHHSEQCWWWRMWVDNIITGDVMICSRVSSHSLTLHTVRSGEGQQGTQVKGNGWNETKEYNVMWVLQDFLLFIRIYGRLEHSSFLPFLLLWLLHLPLLLAELYCLPKFNFVPLYFTRSSSFPLPPAHTQSTLFSGVDINYSVYTK